MGQEFSKSAKTAGLYLKKIAASNWIRLLELLGLSTATSKKIVLTAAGADAAYQMMTPAFASSILSQLGFAANGTVVQGSFAASFVQSASYALGYSIQSCVERLVICYAPAMLSINAALLGGAFGLFLAMIILRMRQDCIKLSGNYHKEYAYLLAWLVSAMFPVSLDKARYFAIAVLSTWFI